MWSNPQLPADLFTFSEEIQNGKLYFLCSEIEDQLNLNFSRLWDWFISNKLSVHLGEDKTKSLPFGTKFNIKRVEPLNTVYGNIKNKQYSKQYSKQYHLGWILY